MNDSTRVEPPGKALMELARFASTMVGATPSMPCHSDTSVTHGSKKEEEEQTFRVPTSPRFPEKLLLKIVAPYEDVLCPGSLIRHAFQNDEGDWNWFVGLVRETWPRTSWFQVAFEDGEILWIHLHDALRGKLWHTIDSDIDVEKVRLERLFTAANPKGDLKAAPDVEAATVEIEDRYNYFAMRYICIYTHTMNSMP